jgi:hypothetical protein
MKTTILFAALFASAAFGKPQPGIAFLLIWPTARSTALAGAMTGLADDPDAAFFNPAGLAFQSGIGATASYADWLPGLYPGMRFSYVAARFSHTSPVAGGGQWAFGLEASGIDFGPACCVLDLQPPVPDVWDGELGLSVSHSFSKSLSVGAKAKLVRSFLVPDWVWKSMPELGIEAGGTGTTWAADVGALWKPTPEFSLGGSVANLGPGVSYTSSGEHDPSPAILRLGACWTPVNDGRVCVNVLPEFDKVLVGMFFDSADTKTFGEELQTELRDVWKTLAIEIRGYEVLSMRLGYFEDRTWQRGGLVFKNRHGETYHYALYDLLTWRNLGKLESVGLCWGFGIGYRDYFRIDVSSDAAIYDFPTKNWKLSLVANDIVGGIREFRQGHVPWEE